MKKRIIIEGWYKRQQIKTCQKHLILSVIVTYPIKLKKQHHVIASTQERAKKYVFIR